MNHRFSLQIVDISDDATNNSDVEMFSCESEVGVIVSEINLERGNGKKGLQNNKDNRVRQ